MVNESSRTQPVIYLTPQWARCPSQSGNVETHPTNADTPIKTPRVAFVHALTLVKA